MATSNRKPELYMLAALIVGGALLFAFVLYLAVAFVVWIVTHPSVLVYAFLVLVVIQAFWLTVASLRKRFQTEEEGERPPLISAEPRPSIHAATEP